MEYFRTGEAIKAGWEKFKAHMFFLWMVLGVLVVSQIIFGFLEEATKEMGFFSVIVSLTTALLGMFMSLGFIRLYLDLIDGGTEGRLSTIFSPNQLFWSYVGASILFGLAVGIGFLLFIVPGIYFAVKYQFYGELIVDKKMNALQALKKSGEITDGVKWQLFGFGLALLGVNILGALALGIGLFVTIPLSSVAYFIVYRKLSVRLNTATPLEVTAQPTAPVQAL
ncbi:MAG: DUF975 family protein [Candidatus Moraniibacteriota bacterium]